MEAWICWPVPSASKTELVALRWLEDLLLLASLALGKLQAEQDQRSRVLAMLLL